MQRDCLRFERLSFLISDLVEGEAGVDLDA
jgi:hypothetical protein